MEKNNTEMNQDIDQEKNCMDSLKTPGLMNPVKYLEYRMCPHRTLAWLNGEIGASPRVFRTFLVLQTLYNPETARRVVEDELGERVTKVRGGWRAEPERLVTMADELTRTSAYREIIPTAPFMEVAEAVHDKVQWTAPYFTDRADPGRGMLAVVGIFSLDLRIPYPWYFREHTLLTVMLTRGIATDWGRSGWDGLTRMLIAGVSDQYPEGSFGFARENNRTYMKPGKDAAVFAEMEAGDDPNLHGYADYRCDCDWCSVNRPGLNMELDWNKYPGEEFPLPLESVK